MIGHPDAGMPIAATRLDAAASGESWAGHAPSGCDRSSGGNLARVAPREEWFRLDRYRAALDELWLEQIASGGHDSREERDRLDSRFSKIVQQVEQLEKDLGLVAQLGPGFARTYNDDRGVMFDRIDRIFGYPERDIEATQQLIQDCSNPSFAAARYGAK